ncbi:MAG TPA: hypothetical protein VGG11_16255 [Xanthobacteraceae bacterium]
MLNASEKPLPLRQKVSPDATLAPLLAFRDALVRRTHGLPGDALGVFIVLNGTVDALLMHHVSLGVVREMAQRPFEFLGLDQKHMRGGAGVISCVPDAAVAVFFKLVFAELK